MINMQMGSILEEYILDTIRKGQRDDGRSFNAYRDISIKSSPLQNTEGSADVLIGNTRVLAGIKIALDEPMSDKPEDGNIITSAELLPIASEKFEPGPPTPEAIELARVIDRGIRAANMIDTKSLFIEKGKVWSVFIDIYVLNYDGNMFDAGTIAAASALFSTRLPRLEGEDVIREGNLERLKPSNLVTSCTFGKIADKILLDMTAPEEMFSKARFTIANDENVVRAMQKGLGGSFSTSELDQMIDLSFEKGKEVRNIIKKATGE